MIDWFIIVLDLTAFRQCKICFGMNYPNFLNSQNFQVAVQHFNAFRQWKTGLGTSSPLCLPHSSFRHKPTSSNRFLFKNNLKCGRGIILFHAYRSGYILQTKQLLFFDIYLLSFPIITITDMKMYPKSKCLT